MPSATDHGAVPMQRIPAWKRLGLKLKSAPQEVEPEQEVQSPKRKQSDAIDSSVPSKKVKRSSTDSAKPVVPDLSTPRLARKKSVTFTPETKAEDGDSIKQLFNGWVAEQKELDPSFELKSSNPVFQTPEPSKIEEQVDSTQSDKENTVRRKKKAKLDKNSKKSTTTKIEKAVTVLDTPPFLEYLQKYHTSRETWKFNKNHQNHLLKHAFDIDVIPSQHSELLYEYVRGLQGAVRTRLRDTAFAIKVKDQEDGVAGFADDMPDKDQRQRDYDAEIAEYVATMTAATVSPKIGYEEGILLGLSDKAIEKRAAKRMRSEAILAGLGADGPPPDAGQKENKEEKELNTNDGPPQKVARKRKQRTVVVDDDSSSEDSSTDSNDSGSEDAEPREANDTSSSSSSSSSSSDSESDSEDSEDSSDEGSDSD